MNEASEMAFIQRVKHTDNEALKIEAQNVENELKIKLEKIDLEKMVSGSETEKETMCAIGNELLVFYKKLRYTIKTLIDDKIIEKINTISNLVIIVEADKIASKGIIGKEASIGLARGLLVERSGGSKTLRGLRTFSKAKTSSESGNEKKEEVKSESSVKWETANNMMFDMARKSGLILEPEALMSFIETLAKTLQNEGTITYRKNNIDEKFLPVEKIEQEFSGFCKKLSADLKGISDKKQNPIVVSARLWEDLTKIHPFSDGNGRVRSLLIDYILICSELPPFIPTLNPCDATEADRMKIIIDGMKASMKTTFKESESSSSSSSATPEREVIKAYPRVTP